MNRGMQKMNRGGEKKKKMTDGGKAKMMNGGMPVTQMMDSGKVHQQHKILKTLQKLLRNHTVENYTVVRKN